jgi:hypothetical protein
MKLRTALGPRGWAALVLAGGATLASPFFRSTAPQGSPEVTNATPPPDFSASTWPDLREKCLAILDDQPNELSDVDWRELSKLQTVSSHQRKVSGALPSTQHDPVNPALPSWAKQGQRVEQVVESYVRGEPMEPAIDSPRSEIQALNPWVKTVPSFPDSQSASSLANSIATQTPDPFAQWNAPTGEQVAYKSPARVKVFEDQPKIWPDEKLKSGDLYHAAKPGISAIVQQDPHASPQSLSPWGTPPSLPPALAQGGSVFPPADPQFNTEPTGPRIDLSSASRREPLPAAPNVAPLSPPPAPPGAGLLQQPPPQPERQRFFIQQPPKRA